MFKKHMVHGCIVEVQLRKYYIPTYRFYNHIIYFVF